MGRFTVFLKSQVSDPTQNQIKHIRVISDPLNRKFPRNGFSYMGSGGVAKYTGLEPERVNAGKLRTTFVCKRGTSCMSPRSRACEKVPRATFFRTTQWFQHTFPFSPEGGPGGSRDAPDAFRGLLGVPPELSEVPPEPLLASFFQDSSPRIPPLRFLLKKSFLRIPLPGFLLQDSISRISP